MGGILHKITYHVKKLIYWGNMVLRIRPLWGFTALMFALFTACVALGVWQLERLQWKLALIAQADSHLKAPPIDAARALAMDARAAQYRRVKLTGRFLNASEAYGFATGEQGMPVYHVLTPFKLDDCRVLMVDRGIVPERLRDPRLRRAGELDGEQHIAGVWRIPDAAGLFTPAPDIAKHVWYARDVQGIAKAEHLRLSAPVIVEADATPNPGGWPKGGQTVITFRNDHLQYAITWFALAAVVLGGWIAFHVSQGRIGWKRRGQE
jgi:surfeit locus 1 family protein